MQTCKCLRYDIGTRQRGEETEMNKVTKATVKIEDSKGTREYEKTFRNPKTMQAYRIDLRSRVETGATITITQH